MVRRCFYSFYYKNDAVRAAQVRQIGSIDANKPTTDNKWEEVTSGGDPAIEKWILDQMTGKSCTIVLIGSNTANRKWINYEIVKSWDSGMGIVGINIHGLKNFQGNISTKGQNPFSYIKYGNSETMLSLSLIHI